QPTRITSSTRTLIDHIFTNKPNIITNHGILHVGISDHSLIYATHKHNTLKADPKIIASRQFKNFDTRVTYFNDSIKKHSGNLKETWNVINSSLGRKPKMTVINELIDEGKVFVQKEDIAEQMNNHFCSLGSKLSSCIPDTASQPEDFLGRTDLNF
ncbi:hypothetical protein P5673_033452, partial [Acropora cervicornis]